MRHTYVTFAGICLDIDYDYEPPARATYLDPPEGGVFIESIKVDGVDISELVRDDYIEEIAEMVYDEERTK